MKAVVTATEVAVMLGLSERAFMAKKAAGALIGFPRALPGLETWSLAQVTAWLERGGGIEAEVSDEARMAMDERRSLELKYAKPAVQ